MIRNLIDYPKDNTFSMPFQDLENEEEKEE